MSTLKVDFMATLCRQRHQEVMIKWYRCCSTKGLISTRKVDAMATLCRQRHQEVMIKSLKGHGEVLKLLLDKGADIPVANANGWTPLNAAAGSGHLEVVKLLLDKGVDYNA